MSYGLVAVAGATLVGGLLASDASSSAANKQNAATKGGLDEQRRQFDLSRSDTAPYRAGGSIAMDQLRTALGMGPSAYTKPRERDEWVQDNYRGGQLVDGIYSGGAGVTPGLRQQTPDQGYQDYLNKFTPQEIPGGANIEASPLGRKFSISDFWNDPVVQASYQSGLDLGTKALKNAAPLTTGLDSGAAMKELTKFGTDYTGNMAAGSQARFVNDQGNQFNRLASLAGIGQTAVGQSSAAGTNSANNASQMITANGNAQGAAKIAGANAFGGGINSVANYWQQQQMLANLKGGNTGTTGYTPAPNSDWYAG